MRTAREISLMVGGGLAAGLIIAVASLPAAPPQQGLPSQGELVSYQASAGDGQTVVAGDGGNAQAPDVAQINAQDHAAELEADAQSRYQAGLRSAVASGYYNAIPASADAPPDAPRSYISGSSDSQVNPRGVYGGQYGHYGEVSGDEASASSAPRIANAGAIDVNSGRYFPSSGSGYVDPQNGTFYASAGPSGVVNTQTGQFVPTVP